MQVIVPVKSGSYEKCNFKISTQNKNYNIQIQ
jgi:hypothetical protein